MSNTDWLDIGVGGKYTIHNNVVGMTIDDVNSMSDLMLTPPIQHIIFGDYSKWCSSLMFYPFDVNRNGYRRNLYVGGAEIENVKCYLLDNRHRYGYNLGQYFYKGINNDYTDFEPYTTLQIYLPYYGFIELPIAQVYRKYIQFRLYVDYLTGQAQYIVGVTDNSILNTNSPPYNIQYRDFNTRIVGTYVFQLGVNIPLGQTGMAETIRNITMGAVKGAATIAASYVAGAAGANVVSRVGSTVQTSSGSYSRTSPKTGRLLQKRGTWDKTVETETSSVVDYSGMQKAARINACFETFADTLANAHLNPSTDKANNTFVNCYGSKSIQIIRKVARKIDATEYYGHIYGHPLGETVKLNTISGYTEIDGVHIEGEGFANITLDERAELEAALSHGFILPKADTEDVTFYINETEHTAPSGFDWISWINFGYGEGYYYDENYVYNSASKIVCLFNTPVKPSDVIIDSIETGQSYSLENSVIEFSVDDVIYTANYNTTWAEFIDSGVVSGFSYDNTYVYDANGNAITLTNGRAVTSYDKIIENYDYITANPLITFTLGGFTYNAERNMTFYEWCANIDYNTANFRCASITDYVYAAESTDKVFNSNGVEVIGSTVILNGATYTIEQ